MGISRSSFYNYLSHKNDLTQRKRTRLSTMLLVSDYHAMYPSHGYRWINAKIRKDLGLILNNKYVYKCFYTQNIKSNAKHTKKYSRTEKDYNFKNIINSNWMINEPMKVIVTDMTAFWANREYWELTLYIDVFCNEIVGYDLSNKKGDRETYFNGLQDVITKAKEFTDNQLILHSDHGSVYSSKAYNELLVKNRITHSMSRVGTPTDNPVCESINGWIKEELFKDFKINRSNDIKKSIADYITYFNNDRPAYALGYLTPAQYKMKYFNNILVN